MTTKIERQELAKECGGISDSTMRSTLQACNLTQSLKEFEPAQADTFREARKMIANGQKLTDVAAKFGGKSPKTRAEKAAEALVVNESTNGKPGAQKQKTAQAAAGSSVTLSQLMAMTKGGESGKELSFREFSQLLSACGLPDDRTRFEAAQVEVFSRGLGLYRQGKSLVEIQQAIAPPQEVVSYEMSQLWELAAQAGIELTPSEAEGVLRSCSISPEKDSFGAEEAKYFMAAAKNFKQQGVPLANCGSAVPLGLDIDAEELSEVLTSPGLDVVKELSKLRARADGQTAEALYFNHLIEEMTSADAMARRQEMFEHLGNILVGKSRARAQQTISETLSRIRLQTSSINSGANSKPDLLSS